MRYSWHYLENMSVCRINPRKMAVVLDDSKRVNEKLTQLKDHLIESFYLPEVEDDTIRENYRNEFLKSIVKEKLIVLCIFLYESCENNNINFERYIENLLSRE